MPGATVSHHYSRKGLYEHIIRRLEEKGVSRITRADLAAADEFHVRGAAVSVELATDAGFARNATVLDVGCGIGGPARMLADAFGCHVTGIDLTTEFVDTAKKLSQRVGLQSQTRFISGDATQMPFENEAFDFVWTQHAQMNVRDKEAFYGEINRVLKQGGKFIYYDIFSADGTVYYPEPWANDPSISFLFEANTLREMLASLGLKPLQVRDQTAAGVSFLRQLFDRIEREGVPTVGLHLLMGDSAREKLENLLRSMDEGALKLESGIFAK